MESRRTAVAKREFTVVYQTIEDGWIMASVPELPGAVTQGRDMDEARSMIKEAVELLLESYRENAARQAPGSAVWETVTVELATGLSDGTSSGTSSARGAGWTARAAATPSTATR